MSEPTSQAEQGPIDLPTGEPIPAAPEATPSSKPEQSSSSSISDHHPSTPSSSNPTALLTALPTKTDAFLTHLQRCLATPSGTDTLLLFICYTSRLTGALATSLSHSLLHRKLLALALTLPQQASSPQATTTIVLASPPLAPTRAALAALTGLLGARLKAVGSLASEARTIARLWGLLSMYSWAKRLLFAPSAPATTAADRLATAVDWTQLVACTAFQALENGAYLSSKNIMGWTPAEQGRAFVVASRWLALYTGLEIGKVLGKMVAMQRSEKTKTTGGGILVEKETSEEEEAVRAEKEALRRSMVINLAWTPLTVHWAAETGFLSDLAVGLGGSIPGVLQMRKLWRETAQ